jgi:hypothetical protein
MPEDFPRLRLVEKRPDPKTRRLAQKYLEAVDRRQTTEYETGTKFDAFPERLLEIFRGSRLARRLGVRFETRGDFDAMLPEMAREHISDMENT